MHLSRLQPLLIYLKEKSKKMKKNRKFLSLFLSVLSCATLVSCGDGNNTNAPSNTGTVTTHLLHLLHLLHPQLLPASLAQMEIIHLKMKMRKRFIQ